jgi:hypothetical protein
MNMGGFQVSLFGQRIAVLTDCRAAEAYLDRYLLPWLPRSAPDPETADLLFRVLQSKESQLFDAYTGDRLIASAEELPAVFSSLQYLTDENLVRCRPDVAAVHAGVVAWNGCAALLPGASRAGKTTLVSELIEKGAVYYSDEYALFDAEGRVHAYPRALMARSSGGSQHPTLPAEWNAGTARPAVPVRLIVSAEWACGQRWSVRRISQSEALLLLLRNTPREMADSPEIVGRLRLAVSSATCYTGVRGEAVDAAARVIELMQ